MQVGVLAGWSICMSFNFHFISHFLYFLPIIIVFLGYFQFYKLKPTRNDPQFSCNFHLNRLHVQFCYDFYFHEVITKKENWLKGKLKNIIYESMIILIFCMPKPPNIFFHSSVNIMISVLFLVTVSYCCSPVVVPSLSISMRIW